VLSSARGATADKGARICAEVIARVASAVRSEFGLP
jgi:hypothetical protein